MKTVRISFEMKIPADVDDAHVLDEVQAMAEDFAEQWCVRRANLDIDETCSVEDVVRLDDDR